MKKQKIMKELQQLKIHLDAIDDWVRQTADMIYSIEDKLIEIPETTMELNGKFYDKLKI